VYASRRLERIPQLPRHWKNGGLRCRVVGRRTRTPGVSKEMGQTADTRTNEESRLQRLASSHSTNTAPGTLAKTAPSQVD